MTKYLITNSFLILRKDLFLMTNVWLVIDQSMVIRYIRRTIIYISNILLVLKGAITLSIQKINICHLNVLIKSYSFRHICTSYFCETVANALVETNVFYFWKVKALYNKSFYCVRNQHSWLFCIDVFGSFPQWMACLCFELTRLNAEG